MFGNTMMFPFPIMFSLLLLLSWTIILKGVALWKAARNDQLLWFIFILLLSTAGILPIIYLLFFQNKTNKNENDRQNN